MTTVKKNRFLKGSLGAGALAGVYLLGSLSLTPVFAQTPSPTGTEQPSYSGSIQLPREDERSGTAEQSEQQEAQALASQAKISADQANQAALAQFPGASVKKTELDNENGSLVYSVELVDSAGKGHEVKVDAGNGTVLQTQADGPEGNEANEGRGGSEANEVED